MQELDYHDICVSLAHLEITKCSTTTYQPKTLLPQRLCFFIVSVKHYETASGKALLQPKYCTQHPNNTLLF
jgi:hypothetical protein